MGFWFCSRREEKEEEQEEEEEEMFGEEEFMLNDFEENGMAYGDVFDKIEDLLDFSSEEMQMLMEPEPLTFDDAALPVASGFPPPATEAPPPVKAPPPATSVADDDNFPCEEDEAELEWLSNFVEESFSPTNIVIPKTNNSPTNGTAQNNGPEPKSEFHYNRTPSPVSVLEDKLAGGGVDAGGPAAGGARRRRGGSLTSSSSSTSSSPTSSSSGCSSGVANGVTALASAFNPPDTVAAVRGRAPRTKRPRPPPAVRSNILGPIEDSLLMVPSIVCSDVDNFADSIPHNPFDHHHAPADDNSETTTDKKKKKLKIVSSASVHREAENSRPTNFAAAAAGAPVRKCMHCEIQKTPQWRAGPMGPKTLCNACGVRYKSGRLFPEYRPAASPTFVPTHHSNSHKKVVEMRVKSSSGKDSMSEVPSSLPVSARGCELLHYIRSC